MASKLSEDYRIIVAPIASSRFRWQLLKAHKVVVSGVAVTETAARLAAEHAKTLDRGRSISKRQPKSPS